MIHPRLACVNMKAVEGIHALFLCSYICQLNAQGGHAYLLIHGFIIPLFVFLHYAVLPQKRQSQTLNGS